MSSERPVTAPRVHPLGRMRVRSRNAVTADGDRGPHTLASAMSEYLHSQGHEEAYVLGAVCAHWADVVGADVAAHVTPASVRDGELRVSVDHAGWVTQLAFLSDQILARLGEQLGQHLVGRLKVTVRARPGVE